MSTGVGTVKTILETPADFDPGNDLLRSAPHVIVLHELRVAMFGRQARYPGIIINKYRLLLGSLTGRDWPGLPIIDRLQKVIRVEAAAYGCGTREVSDCDVFYISCPIRVSQRRAG